MQAIEVDLCAQTIQIGYAIPATVVQFIQYRTNNLMSHLSSEVLLQLLQLVLNDLFVPREDGWWVAEDEEGNKGTVPSTYFKVS